MDQKTLLLIMQNSAVIVSSILVYFITQRPVKKYFENKKAIEKTEEAISQWEQGIEDMRVIRQEHQILYSVDNIPRNAFFIAHNGGSYPSKENNFYCAVKDETGIDSQGIPLGHKMEFDYGNSIKVDFSYAVMIEEAYKHGHVHYKNIDDMPDCLLKRIYKKEKVAESIVVFYSLNPKSFRFGYSSHARYENDPPFTPDQINSIVLSGNRLRTKFNSQLMSMEA